MKKDFIAKASILIDSPLHEVWDALINPSKIKKYMFDTNVVSNWKKGDKIFWRGEWNGKSYEDKGVILEIIPNKLIKYSHFSPLSEIEDKPENYHNVTVELSEKNKRVFVSLSQDNNSSEGEKNHSEQNWKMMLEGMKRILEG